MTSMDCQVCGARVVGRNRAAALTTLARHGCGSRDVTAVAEASALLDRVGELGYGGPFEPHPVQLLDDGVRQLARAVSGSGHLVAVLDRRVA